MVNLVNNNGQYKVTIPKDIIEVKKWSAKTRLREELEREGSLEINSINWLINNFTDYYPQVFFEGKVIDFLQKKIQELETKHWLSKRGINLSEYFVEPPVNSLDHPVKSIEEGIEQIMTKRRIPFSQLKSIF